MIPFLLVFFACIPKPKYDAALADAQAKAAQIEKLKSHVAGLQSVEADLRRDLARATAEVQKKHRELDDKRRELANMASEAGALAANVENMQQALQELEQRRASSEATLQEFRDLVSRFRAMIDAGTLKVKVIDGRMIVELATDILFGAGSAKLSPAGREALTEVAGVLASIPDREFQVAGHTDNQPIHTAQFPSNWHLGSSRAIAVSQVLIEAGLPPDRVSAASYAEFRPADSNRTTAGRANNRRIEIVVVPDLSSMPGFEELSNL